MPADSSATNVINHRSLNKATPCDAASVDRLLNHQNLRISSSNQLQIAFRVSLSHASSTGPWLWSIAYITALVDAERAKGVRWVRTRM